MNIAKPEWENFVHLRTGATIYPSHDRAIDNLLGDLIERCPAHFLLLADSSGLVVTAKGDRGKTDLVALASLIAGDIAASQEIARLTSQYQSCQLVLREGAKINSFLLEAGKHLVLFAQVSREVPMGWARLLLCEASRQLEEIIATPAEDIEQLDLGLDDENLNDFINDALDSIWTS